MLAVILGSCSGDDNSEKVTSEPVTEVTPETTTPPNNETPPSEETPPNEETPGEFQDTGLIGKWKVIEAKHNGQPIDISDWCENSSRIEFNYPDTGIEYRQQNGNCDNISTITFFHALLRNELLIMHDITHIERRGLIRENTADTLKILYYYYVDGPANIDLGEYLITYKKIP